MKALRTPDEAFEGLPDWPHEPKYIELDGFDGLRTHYVDVGSGDQVFLCLHGQPTWSYLYRKMIPVFAGAPSGARVIAPDFFGFGRSDKPTDEAVYTFDFHRRTLLAFIEALDLRHVTLVCQDWGGILGLTLPMDTEGRIERLVVMNTAIATGLDAPSPGFIAWRAFSRQKPDYDVAGLMKRAVPGIRDDEAAAYRAPFPDASYRAGVRRFPDLVPVEPDMEGADIGQRAAAWFKSEWTGPSFIAVGEQDPVLGVPVMDKMQALIPGASDLMRLPEAGHFVQEHGARVALAALAHFGR